MGGGKKQGQRCVSRACGRKRRYGVRGRKALGAEYAGLIAGFDCAEYAITAFEAPVQTADIVQVHYIIKTTAAAPENSDLSGTFHITSTWKNMDGAWKLVFNMDSRIYE